MLANASAALLVLTACSGSGEDVRITLCKNLVSVQLGGSKPTKWTETKTETRGYEHAAVQLRWVHTDGPGAASCYFDYNAVEHTAMALGDPLSSYSASPSRMVMNGKTLSKPALAHAIEKAMRQQGRSFVSGVINRVN
ncbi:MAG: hypothetical protein WBG92_17165 [Thiohalocapsa sp.]